ncbi:N-6 DNA methylase [Promethearchaeum syntrophicum]|uniref:site-specific DNA-methyltransferase (adenine-specific) n=1 Tax=Promethearchaeum syntrophicum TaxID=2594042 RepID=A0A5B9DFQ7_9ARCH|nr:N-6 DNA methylase [Candidatus Prometheoarchaeum syntrophicum]QEE17623.1 N-6 DNA Methylase [Candidatus Prometheoarchaeum syntrophicum]
MKKEPEITKHHPNQQELGTYFTPTPVAEWISSRVLERLFVKLKGNRNIKIYDPTIGEGVFLTAIVNNLEKLFIKKPQTFAKIERIQLFGSDLQKKYIDFCLKSITKLISEKSGIKYAVPKILKADGFIELLDHPRNYDIILGNPPYIRQEALSIKLKSKLRTSISLIYPDFQEKISKQADYYIFFIMAGYSALKLNGILAFVVSTSWMNSKFGKNFRKFLINLPARITFAFSPKKRLISDVKINTMIIFIQKEKTKHKNFEIQKLKLSDNGILTLSSSKKVKHEKLNHISNWETYFFRLPAEFFNIYKLFSEHLIPLNQIAEVKTGIYTGLNDFFYIKRDKKEDKKNPRPGSQFLFNVIRSPKKINNWEITQENLSHQLFICQKSKEHLKKQDIETLNYILWGEMQSTRLKQKVITEISWPNVPSVINRTPGWWSFPNVKPTNVFLRYIYYQNFLQPISTVPIFSDRCFHQIYPYKGTNYKRLSLILNFAITQLFIEINGRNTLGQGALKLETMSARILPTLNCINLDVWDTIPNLDYSHLQEIEIAIYKSLGIRNPKEIYKQINSIHHHLVQKRIKKSINI